MDALQATKVIMPDDMCSRNQQSHLWFPSSIVIRGRYTHPEMIWILPVQRTAMTNQNMLVMQQIQRELLIGVNIELFDVQLREDTRKRRFRLNCGNAGNFIEHLIDQFALLVHAATWLDVVLDALMSAQSGLYHRLSGNIRRTLRMFASMFKPSM